MTVTQAGTGAAATARAGTAGSSSDTVEAGRAALDRAVNHLLGQKKKEKVDLRAIF